MFPGLPPFAPQTNEVREQANGPTGSPELYDTSSGDIKFKVEAIPKSEKFSRNGAQRLIYRTMPATPQSSGTAGTNDNLLISQFHLAILMFHNAVIDRLRADPSNADCSAQDIFKEAQQ